MVERSLTTKMEDARDAAQFKLQEILQAYRSEVGNQSSGLVLPPNLSLLPLITLGILKHISLRLSNSISSDTRSYASTS